MVWKVGDLVWVRVHGYPTWPGQVMDPAKALAKVRAKGKPGQTLVSFFADSTFGWFDPHTLQDFRSNYEKRSAPSKGAVRNLALFRDGVPLMGSAYDTVAWNEAILWYCEHALMSTTVL
jgi:hypothetical protein